MATYYVKTYASGGRDEAGKDGLSLDNAWATPSYASGRVPAGDNIIYIESGTYTDNSKVVLALNVNMLGNSTTPPEITTSYVATGTTDGYLYLNSSSGNAVDGNQYIAYLNINGNSTTATRVGSVNFRSNVKIHHCGISDFLYSGIRFYGSSADFNVTPTNTLPVGNEVYYCTFNNCSTRVGNSIGGHVRSDCQNGMSIHHNTFTQNSRAVGYNGNTFSGYQNYGLQVYNNIWTKPDNNYTESLDPLYTWNFFMEFHYSHGGIDMYNNEFIGIAALDFSGTEKGTYTYGGRIYDNIFRSASGGFAPYNEHNEPFVDLESFDVTEDVYIFRNKFSYGRSSIYLANVMTSISNIYIYDNIIENTGNSDNGWDNAILISSSWDDTNPIPISNVFIYNNVITAGKSTLLGIGITAVGDITNLNIKNNIIYGAFSRPIRFSASAAVDVDGCEINNNIFYGNTTNSILYDDDIDFTDLDDSGNLAGSSYNPSFVGGSPYSYELSSTSSPAYHAGYDVDLATDYAGNSFHETTPSIGAYEWVEEEDEITVKNATHVHFSII